MGKNENLDNALIERVKQGNKRAFDMLVLKYQYKVVQLVFRFVKDKNEAEDIAQETFIKAYRSLSNFRGESAFYTWLYRIAVNTAKNFLQNRQKKPLVTDINVDEAMHDARLDSVYENATPENILHSEEVLQALYQALEQLPEDLRAAITLREMDSLSYEDIAQVLNCPVGTVRSRIFRARDSIDKALQPLLKN